MMKKVNAKTYRLFERNRLKSLLAAAFMFGFQFMWSQNPLVRDQYTADPTARVFNDKIYV